MSPMNMPGFTAGTSPYKTIGHYRAGRGAINSSMEMIFPAIPLCRNCDRLIDLCHEKLMASARSVQRVPVW
jgi:hypothetical protein